jgi:glycosyltransferase involved in cell wall biosynthesis
MDKKISILMPAYNTEKYIAAAIQSVLDQSFSAFELIIVNDGSTDGTKEIILSFQDERIVYKENVQNRGLAYTRNRLIDAASSEIIAWIDADDIYHKNFLEKGYSFLCKNLNYKMVTAWARIIDGDGRFGRNYFKAYANERRLPLVFLFVNYIVQSSVMVRKEVFEFFKFDEAFPVILDFEMWVNIASRYKIKILREVLVDYRIHNSNMSATQSKQAQQAILKLYARNFTQLGLTFSPEELNLHYDISFGLTVKNISYFDSVESWLLKLKDNNKIKELHNLADINGVFSHRWVKVCLRENTLGMVVVKKMMSSPLFKYNVRNLALLAKYLMR